MNIEYLFLPKKVEEILQNYPILSSKLSPPLNEGQPSIAFSEARKSQRQIYRILANQQYPHLVELLKSFEYCLSIGYESPSLLQTRNQSQFSSAVSELLVSHFLIKRGFKVSGYDHSKGQERTPDIFAKNNITTLIAEVYHPRDWEGLDLFLDDIDLYLKYLDRPLDFVFDLDNKLISKFDDEGSLLHFDPWEFSEAMETQKYRLANISEIIAYIDKNLNSSCPEELGTEFLYHTYNLKTTLKIKHIKLSSNIYPARFGSFSPPILTGFAPEGMFDLLVKKRIRSKLREKQIYNVKGQHLRMLIVDISRLAYWNVFEHSIYLSKFKESIKKYLKENSIKSDVVVFCTPRVESRGGLTVNLIFRKKNISNNLLKNIFGKVNEEIII